ncbi:MAG: pyrimidine reductase family protein [Sporichthyaceae bacterium]
MRSLLPEPAGTVDLVHAYAYPGDGAWVRANMVASIDGSAVADGKSEPLSGPADKRVFGVLRGLADVVLVGAGTARAEGYRGLKARPSYAEHRAGLGQRPAPVLALVSASLDLDPATELFTGSERTIVLTTTMTDESARARLAEVAEVIVTGTDRVDLSAAIDALVALGLPRVLCEGGPHLLADLVAAGRLDELCLTTTPRLVGGDGPRIVADLHLGDVLELGLAHLIEEDGNLFARYLVSRA